MDRKRMLILAGVGVLLIALAALSGYGGEQGGGQIGVLDFPEAVTSTPTPDWATKTVATLIVTVDGSLAEWTAVAGITLNSTTAANIQRTTPVPSITPLPSETPS